MGNSSSDSLIWQLVLILVLTLVNAFFAAAEMAIVSVDKKRLSSKAEEGDKKAEMVLEILKEPSRFLSTIQVGITFAGFFSSASAAVGISDDLGIYLTNLGIPFGKNIAFIGVTIILSYVILVLGELVPKRVALQNAEKFSMFAIGTIRAFAKIMKPFVSFLSFSTNGIIRLLGFNNEGVEEKITMEELRSLVEVGQEQGLINPVEREMIDSVMGFDDILAEEIMTARTEVFMLNIEDPIEENLPDMMQLKYSRIPVYENDVDNIIGILFLKDFLLEAYNVGFNRVNIRSILRPAYFVPESKNINDLFLELQNTRNHMAILIDEYGGFSGIVTMEDLIEEIMGDIEDEYDEEESTLKKIDDNIYYADGLISIRDLNSELDLNLDEDSDFYDTLGGFIIHSLGYIPKDENQRIIQYENIEFHIEDIQDRRIQGVKIIIKKEETEVENEEDEEEE